MKNSLIIIILAVVILGVIVSYIFLNKNIENVILTNNQLKVNNFKYIYDRQVSHICSGPIESLNFLYNGNSITITAQEKNFNEGIGQNIEDYYPNCVNKGDLMNLYDNSKGLPSGLPSGCEIIVQLPSDYDKPEFLSVECNSKVKFKILNYNGVSSCLLENECILINGLDVEIL
ncbi:MAG: hypothetical protein AABX30_02765 [Nanoarchaeota archaeon]